MSKLTRYYYDEKIFMPNEIFDDYDINKLPIQHRGFVYCYYYMVCYLYKYCRYNEEVQFTQEEIKEFLGYHKTSKRVDYLIKKGGFLDTHGYTETTNNFPVSWHINDETKQWVIETVEDLKSAGVNLTTKSSRNFKVKYPVRAFYRDGKKKDDDSIYDGTFYNIKHTHEINFNIFKEIVDLVGTTGMYYYGYIKSKSFLKGYYQVSLEYLADELLVDRTCLQKKLKTLETNKHLIVQRFPFYSSGGKPKPNIYKPLS